MDISNLSDLAPWLKYLSGLSATIIIAAAAFHLFSFFVLSMWYRRDLSVIAGCLDDFTRGLKHRSVLGRNAPLTNQIDAFVADINDNHPDKLVINRVITLRDSWAKLEAADSSNR